MVLRIASAVWQRPFASAAALALLLLMTAAAAWLWAHEGHEALPTKGVTVDVAKGLVALGPEARRALAVQTGEVAQQALDARLIAPATLVAPWQRHAFATTRMAGKVSTLPVQPGQRVDSGQVLAEVQSLELEDLQRELLIAQDAARLSATNLKNLESSSRQGNVSDRQLQEHQAKHQENTNALEIARRKLLGLGVDEAVLEKLLHDRDPQPLRTLPIRSPIAGVVLHVDVQIGQVVEPTQHLFEIVDLATVWVNVSVLEKDWHQVKVGQAVEVRFPAHPSRVFPCTIQVKGLALDPKTHLGTVWAELSNPPEQPLLLLPGMAAQAQLLYPQEKKMLTIPTAALIRDGAEAFVLVEEGPGQYTRRNMVTGRRANDLVEVRPGPLFPGDRVVTEGSHELATLFVQGVLRVSPEAAQAIGLKVEPAQRHAVEEVVQLGGNVELPASRRAIVSSRLSGTVSHLHVDRDQHVRAGEVLAEVASLEFQNMQLELLRYHLELTLRERILENLRPLARTGAFSERALREAESAALAARQRREGVRSKLSAIGLTVNQVNELLEKGKFLEALPIRASLAGNVVRFHATLGQAIKAEDPLLEIHDLTGAGVRGFVSEQQWPRLHTGQNIRVRLIADPGFVGEAVLVRSDPVFGSASHTLSIWGEWKSAPQASLLHGMMARLTLVVSEPAPTMAVPRAAVWREGAMSYLFVRHADGVFERRLVGTGRVDDRFVEISQGLKENEEIAIQGVANLQTAFASLK